MPVVSVIVLNFNGRRWLPACLNALAEQRDPPPFETLLVDNGSLDESVVFTRTSYPAVQLIETGRNLGFAAGNNLGASHASGEWLAFLNNDTVAEPTWLARLVSEAAAHADYDLVTSRLVFLNDPSIVDSAGDGYFRAGGAFKHGHGAAADSFAVSREVFGACGGAFMIRRELFESLGGFDESFFMVYEDVDLSYRARLRGARVWYAASAVVRHAGSGSIGTASPESIFFGQRNLEWVWIKNTPRELLLASAASHLVYSLAGVGHYLRSGGASPALRGKWAALRGLRRVLADRRRVQASRAPVVEPLDALMEPRWLAAKRREKRFDLARRVT